MESMQAIGIKEVQKMRTRSLAYAYETRFADKNTVTIGYKGLALHIILYCATLIPVLVYAIFNPMIFLFFLGASFHPFMSVGILGIFSLVGLVLYFFGPYPYYSSKVAARTLDNEHKALRMVNTIFRNIDAAIWTFLLAVPVVIFTGWTAVLAVWILL